MSPGEELSAVLLDLSQRLVAAARAEAFEEAAKISDGMIQQSAMPGYFPQPVAEQIAAAIREKAKG